MKLGDFIGIKDKFGNNILIGSIIQVRKKLFYLVEYVDTKIIFTLYHHKVTNLCRELGNPTPNNIKQIKEFEIIISNIFEI